MANDSLDGLVLECSVDGLTLGDDELKVCGSALLTLVRYHERRAINLSLAIYEAIESEGCLTSTGLAYLPQVIGKHFKSIGTIELRNTLTNLCRDSLIELRPGDLLDRFDSTWGLVNDPQGNPMPWARVLTE